MKNEEIKKVAKLFGANDDPVLLTGGQGTTWKVGDIILKPSESESKDLADLMQQLPAVDYLRLPKPIRSSNESWIEDGYVAWTYLSGKEVDARYKEKVGVSELFSTAFSGIPKPRFIEERNDPWSVADRVTWGEFDKKYEKEFQNIIDDIEAHCSQVNLSEQIIHGDIAGNIVFENDLPPAVIDITLYWRPKDYAKALLVVDAITWEGAKPEIFDLVRDLPNIEQLILRAGLRRIIEQPEHIRAFEKDINVAQSEAEKYHQTLKLLQVC